MTNKEREVIQHILAVEYGIYTPLTIVHPDMVDCVMNKKKDKEDEDNSTRLFGVYDG